MGANCSLILWRVVMASPTTTTTPTPYLEIHHPNKQTMTAKLTSNFQIFICFI